MDFALPEDLRMLQAQVRRLVDTEMIPVERETCEGEELKKQIAELQAKLEGR